MKIKIAMLLLLSSLLIGCSTDKAPKELTFQYITDHPDDYVEKDSTSFDNLIEIKSTVKRIEKEEPSQELIDYMIEKGADKYVDVYAPSYFIYVDDCNTPLEIGRDLHLFVNHEYTFVIDVYKIGSDYHFQIVQVNE